MALSDSKKGLSIERAEHVSVDDGENINAKRVALYETADGVTWQRVGTQFDVLLDDSSDPVLYLGKAPIGSAMADPVWQIAKLDTSSGLAKTWADNAGFTQVWDDHESLTYS